MVDYLLVDESSLDHIIDFIVGERHGSDHTMLSFVVNFEFTHIERPSGESIKMRWRAETLACGPDGCRLGQ